MWPNYEAGAQSRNFVLSVMFLINEKFRERASVWEFVGCDPFFVVCARHDALTRPAAHRQSRESVSKLFSTLCNAEWLAKQQLTRPERVALMRFLVGCFQALSSEVVRAELLKLVHVPLWDAVSPQRRDNELKEAPKSIQKQWRVYCTQKQKGKSFARETNFLPFIVDMVTLFLSVGFDGVVDDDTTAGGGTARRGAPRRRGALHSARAGAGHRLAGAAADAPLLQDLH